MQGFDAYRALHFHDESLGFSLDVSRIGFAPDFLASMQPRWRQALEAMEALERGAIANVDENRQVGHYWLRAPALAPSASIRHAIEETLVGIAQFAALVHAGEVKPQKAERFTRLLLIGIGGSALGPRFVAGALGGLDDRMTPHFLDNTDPDGFDLVLNELGERLDQTLCVVISKSGGTRETRNGMLEAKAAYERQGLAFGRHAVAVTGENSELDRFARAENFIERFPMWDWVGGRTSELSAVGLLPAALQGLDTNGLLAGARAMDELTRRSDASKNPAALLSLAWLSATGGQAKKAMVVLPYKDRLELFSRYLQQLVMESLGKAQDLDGRVVHQGLTVYGNKGSTDQHAYVQQLRDGPNDFFVTFLEVLRDRAGNGSLEVEPGVTSGDYLFGFLQGTRQALTEAGRASVTITVDDVSARTVGALIALYERAVGFYASYVGINAYHQPGVEAGKKAAGAVLALQAKVLDALRGATAPLPVEEVARAAGSGEVETVFAILRHLAANERVKRALGDEADPFTARWSIG